MNIIRTASPDFVDVQHLQRLLVDAERRAAASQTVARMFEVSTLDMTSIVADNVDVMERVVLPALATIAYCSSDKYARQVALDAGVRIAEYLHTVTADETERNSHT